MKFTVVVDEKKYVVEIQDIRSRPVIAIVDGEAFEVWPENGDAAQKKDKEISAPRPPIQSTRTPPGAAKDAGNAVRAPIPGVIIHLLVKEGDDVQPGKELLVIEAMKMKNTLRANREGKIQSILVSPGQTVNHGAILLTYAE